MPSPICLFYCYWNDLTVASTCVISTWAFPNNLPLLTHIALKSTKLTTTPSPSFPRHWPYRIHLLLKPFLPVPTSNSSRATQMSSVLLAWRAFLQKCVPHDLFPHSEKWRLFNKIFNKYLSNAVNSKQRVFLWKFLKILFR